MQVTRQLVEQDKVFAVFNSLGTDQNLQVRDYLKAQGVPQVFVASGATTWGRDVADYPGTIGLQPSYQAEGWIYGKYLARTMPTAKIGVIYQNDDYGNDLAERPQARPAALEDPRSSGPSRTSSTPPTCARRSAKLKCAKADVLAIFATPKLRDPDVRRRQPARLEAEAHDRQLRLLRRRT